MTRFFLRRFLFLFLTMFLVSVAVFVMTELAPGNIAINVLGHTITPEQEASFNAQHGLDQPPLIRYIQWMIGSDWRATRLVGMPLERVRHPETNRYSWWAVTDDGTLVQHYSPDGDAIVQVERQPDGSTVETPLGDEIWQLNEEGLPVFWGVDLNGRAAMWVRGDDLEAWVLTQAAWTSRAAAPRQYIPLQKGLLRGDPGISFQTRRPVSETLFRRLANTAFLAGIAIITIMPLALLLGIIAGVNEGKLIDRVLSINGLVAAATPEFVSGIFLILIFAMWLGWFPGAVVAADDTAIFRNPQMLVLPVLTLTLIELGYILRITRTSMVQVMRANYIRSAVLKGLPRRQVIFKHALRNALMAPITVIMLHINWLIGGIVVVESVFGFPGLGRYIVEAALFKDLFALQAATMFMVIIAITTQLLADISYMFLNPKIRYT